MKNTKKTLIILSLALGLPALALGEVLTTSADFMQLPVGGRYSAMNGNVLATADDIETLNAGIGGLSRLSRMQILLQHEQWYLGIGHEVVAVATPLKVIFPGKLLPGVAGFSAEWLHTGNFPSIDSWGNEVDSVGLSGLVFRLGYAIQILRNDALDLGVGGSLGFVNQSMLSVSGSLNNVKPDGKPALDLGAHAKIYHHQASLNNILGDSFSAALLVQNVDFVGKGTSSLPFHFKFGLGGTLYRLITLDIGLSYYKGKALVPGLGAEYWLKDLVAFRLGFKYDPDNPSMLSGGIGFKQKLGNYWLYIDTGAQFSGSVSSIPPVNISVRFDISKIEPKDKTDFYYYKGVDFFVHNDYKNAISMWQKVLAKNPDHAEAKKRIGEAQRLMKLEDDQKKLQNLELNFQQMKEMNKINSGSTNAVPKAPSTGSKPK